MALQVLFYSTICSAAILIPSVPIYLILLYSQFKFRDKFPFNSSFFKLAFNLGIFDIIHLINYWLIGMLHHIPGLYDVIVANASIFAKQFSIVWWFSVLAQKFTVLCLGIDRVACMWFGYVSLWILGVG